MAIGTPELLAVHGDDWSARLDELLAEVDGSRTLARVGVERVEFQAALPALAKAAFSDPSIRTNPRIPLLTEIVALRQTGCGG